MGDPPRAYLDVQRLSEDPPWKRTFGHGEGKGISHLLRSESVCHTVMHADACRGKHPEIKHDRYWRQRRGWQPGRGEEEAD